MLCYLPYFFYGFLQYFVLVHLCFRIPLLREFQPRKQHTIIDRNKSLSSPYFGSCSTFDWRWQSILLLFCFILNNRTNMIIVLQWGRLTFTLNDRDRRPTGILILYLIGIFSDCGLDKEERREDKRREANFSVIIS